MPMTLQLPHSTEPSPEHWIPKPDMLEGVKWLVEHAASALFCDPGWGKTAVTLAAFAFLHKRGAAHRALVVAPKGPAYATWPAEIEKWAEFQHLRWAILHGTEKDLMRTADADVFITTPDMLPWLARPAPGQTRLRITQLQCDTLIADELQKYKHMMSKRSKTMRLLVPRFQRRWGLTGSPAANGLIDLFAQMLVIDRGKAFGTRKGQFVFDYFTPKKDDTGREKWFPKPGAKERIYERLRPVALRRDLSQREGMPAWVDVDILVDLPAAAQKAYDEMEAVQFARLQGRVLTAANAGVALGKCHQIAGGGVYLPNAEEQDLALQQFVRFRTVSKVTRDVLEIHDAKTAALESIVDELQGQPLLVGYAYDHDYQRICKALDYDVPVIRGGTSGDDRVQLIREWNAGKHPVFCGQAEALALGVNMQKAGHHVCWFTETWNYEHYKQFTQRVLRPGNAHEHVIVYHILTRGTVDMTIHRCLKGKGKVEDNLFAALRQRLVDGRWVTS